jgi:hypothetical protein
VLFELIAKSDAPKPQGAVLAAVVNQQRLGQNRGRK